MADNSDTTISPTSNTTATTTTATSTPVSSLAPLLTTVAPILYADQGLSGGSVFCLLFFLVACAYFGGGILLRKFLRGAEGFEMIPNYPFWADLPSLVREGIVFAVNGCKSELSYDRI